LTEHEQRIAGGALARIVGRAAGVPLLSLSLLTACFRTEPPADLVIANGAEPETLDPALVTGQADIRVVRSLFEGLMRLNPVTARPEPGLAERWDVSPDGTVYTFHLRPGAVWSTGEPIRADDVVYSWLRVLKPDTAADYAGQLFFIRGAEDFLNGRLKDPAGVGVKALDPHTLRVELASPTPFFLDLCTFPTLAVVPRRAIERHGERWALTPPVPFNGPYTLVSWRLSDRVRVRKNPRYWDAASVRCEVVDFLSLESPATALNLYETGQADIIWDKNLIPSELMDVLRRRPDCHTFDYLGSYFYRYNVTRKPFDDVRVRKALALAVDKRVIVEKITKGGEKAASHFTPKGMAHYDPPEGLGHDPTEARRLLVEAGFPGGRGFPRVQYLFNSSKTEVQIAVELQAMWQKELGLAVELRPTEWKVYLAAQTALDYDLSRSSWVGDYNDPNTFLDLWMSHNGNNRTGWKNERYDALMRAANAQLDPARRAALLREAEAIVVRDALPIVPLYFYAGINFYDGNRISGVYTNLLDEHPVHAIAKKRVAVRRP
jgi:oligopeptide transport system substrate-binding protein